ncbi:MAG: CehA/McbA family metallohydrolase [Planctomycetes bacterium]|nr:CehA/McbA family metallohydrolase [Planctomycetota bacterium]
MKDYHPLNLTRVCNVNASFIGFGEPPVGRQIFHGLPFQIGSAKPEPKRKCLIGFLGEGGATTPVTIPINAAPRCILFAHTLLETRIPKGEPIGRVVANYTIRFADGDEMDVPVRERFEVASVPMMWGQFPFLAVADKKDGLIGRYSGQWSSAGQRLTEVHQQWPWAYWLWSWENPRPGVKITSVTVEPTDRKFAVAGVTLGFVDEYPFSTAAREDVKITLNKKDDAEKPYELDVEIDRGVATYAFALPAAAAKQYLADTHKGWGDAQNNKSTPAYARIAGTPSATVTVKHKGKPIGKLRWGDLKKKRKVKTPRVTMEIIDTGKNWVHTTVVDDETGKPVHCRVHFRSAQGVPYQPHGHHDHVYSNLGSWHVDIGGDLRLGQATYAYIDGKCQGWLPRGGVIADVARGYEYEPLRQMIEIKPGQREVTLRLKRWVNMNAQRWFSGDTHVHFLGERGAHREAGGEDLNVVNLLASQWGHLFTNTEDFIGRPTASDDGKTIVYCTQENRQHLLGHITLLGLKEPVSPWCTDGPAEAEIGGNLETTLSHWADACHAQGGTVVIPHLPTPNAEPAALIATGRADAVEMLVHSEYCHLEYYRYLNCGYKLPLVGGTDKMDSAVPVGLCRTYVYVPPEEEFNYDNWCKNMRLGRTFLSSGPIIRMTVDGHPIGDEYQLPGDGGTVEIQAVAESIFPIHTLQIVQAGKIVASTDDASGARTLRLKATVKVDRHTWFAARCAGPKYEAVTHHDSWGRGIFAHTSPVYVAVGGPWHMFDLATANYMLTLIDGSVQHIRKNARREDEENVTHHHTWRDHQEFLESPFRQASDALHKRMHQMGIPH